MNSLVPCTYRNLANHPQILRISDARAYFERTVFPNQCIVFDAPVGSIVEIHEDVTALPSDTICCEELRAVSADLLLQYQPAEIA
ncbi:MAG: DUF1830 domain-containing protein [Pseudanabaenaceae cyanobacterium SKYGB_i_bin29]|nr:DUF1830 domain-containing protein [Pseudanabaenaceae cyanobacterium SKYG29]MDW8421099.1 DUF1830 domain-containing protein [Pseudanabaenaceae cyanobacterium SKYGB_i_bin29]